MKKILSKFNRPVLIVGAICAIGVWCLALVGFLSAAGESRGEALVFVIAWPVVYAAATLFLAAILSSLNGAISAKVLGKHHRVIGLLGQVCVLVGLPCTLLYQMVLGILGKG